MSHRRSLSWSAALRDLRADRITYDPEERRAYRRREIFAKIAADRARASARTRPLVISSGYNRRAIMSAAIISAKARRTVTGEPWNICLSAALKGTWQAAKEARRFLLSLEKRKAEREREARAFLAARSMSGEGQGSSAYSDSGSPSCVPTSQRPRNPTLRRSDVSAQGARLRPAEASSTNPAPR